MERKNIYCPRCGRKVATWDGKSQMNIISACRKCWINVVYNVSTQETKIKKIPERNTSSGMRFY